jgi:S-DNA-T family DNA segregation ATPase FtsK/SpoIIIE
MNINPAPEFPHTPAAIPAKPLPALRLRLAGLGMMLFALWLMFALITYHPTDPSLNTSGIAVKNLLGKPGAMMADLVFQSLGWAGALVNGLIAVWGLGLLTAPLPRRPRKAALILGSAGLGSVLSLALLLSALPIPKTWPLATGLGGVWGDGTFHGLTALFAWMSLPAPWVYGVILAVAACVPATLYAFGLKVRDLEAAADSAGDVWATLRVWADDLHARRSSAKGPSAEVIAYPQPVDFDDAPVVRAPVVKPQKPVKDSGRAAREAQDPLPLFEVSSTFRLPDLSLLSKGRQRATNIDEAALRQNAQMLVSVLNDFGVKGEITQIRPGPVVTLYELEPAPGVKSSRVIGLSDDIARSMSAAACRVAVVSGRNAIGIELPNARRETVYLREVLASQSFEQSGAALPLALGETINGEPLVVDLAKMPHLLIAGTTGSGKSVGVNAMILSILYRLSPEQCRFIMIDPKMLELSVYDGIPHLLAPVVTDPKKAVAALKWTVREMEDRYRRMSKVGVRNIQSYNEKAVECARTGTSISRTVQTGYTEAGAPLFESEDIIPEAMPLLVVVIDEMADLMLVAGKEIEGAVQRLAQMARAAGIHLITATQRPSVDVITGTIKANFPTRISFQVTSKIDSRTILGEQGAEQLLGQGDMLYMAGGGRIRRVHGPFVTDQEVEKVAAYLKSQGAPNYLETITAGADTGDGTPEGLYGAAEGSGDELFDRAVEVVARDQKASTSYIQRRLQIGYNKAATIMERMEADGMVGPPNHAGKREIFLHNPGE